MLDPDFFEAELDGERVLSVSCTACKALIPFTGATQDDCSPLEHSCPGRYIPYTEAVEAG